MTLKQAIRIVRMGSTGEGQLRMTSEQWEQLSFARKIVAEEYVKHVAG